MTPTKPALQEETETVSRIINAASKPQPRLPTLVAQTNFGQVVQFSDGKRYTITPSGSYRRCDEDGRLLTKKRKHQ